jgi:hypothetical protein
MTTAVDWFGLAGLNEQLESEGKPEHVYVNGRTVVVFPPLVVVKPVVLLTVIFTWPVCPWFTLNVPLVPSCEFSVKLSFVAVTVKLTVVVAETDPEVPVTVTLSAPAATSEAAAIVTVVVPLPPLTLVGLKLHEMPLAGFVQLKLTVPLKFDPLAAATVIVAVKLLPAVTVVGLIELADSAKPFVVAAQAVARLFTSTDPRPVTRL